MQTAVLVLEDPTLLAQLLLSAVPIAGDPVVATQELLEQNPDLRFVVLAATAETFERSATQGPTVQVPQQPVRRANTLTPREEEVLHLLAAGFGVREIAHRAHISLHTSRGHVKSILAKLDSHSQLEAVAKAVRQGLVDVKASMLDDRTVAG